MPGEITPDLALDWTSFEDSDHEAAMNGWTKEAVGSRSTIEHEQGHSGNRVLRGPNAPSENALGVLIAKQFEHLEANARYVFAFRVRHNGSSPRPISIQPAIDGTRVGERLTLEKDDAWTLYAHRLTASSPAVRLAIEGVAAVAGPVSSQAWDPDDLVLQESFADVTDFIDRNTNGWTYKEDPHNTIGPRDGRWALSFGTGDGDHRGVAASKSVVLLPATRYRFSVLAIRNNNKYETPKLSLQIGDEPPSQPLDINSDSEWVELAIDLQSPVDAPRKALFKIINGEASGMGNDYSVTHIRITEIS